MKWYKKYLQVFEKPFSNTPEYIIEQVKSNVSSIQSKQPLVSIVIIAHNEQDRLLSCIWSLSDSKTEFPIEIIGVDNNSSDSTSKIFEQVGVPCYIQEKKGPGHARQKGLDVAKGKYILCIDSDTLYPPTYVQEMVKEISKPGVVAVSASYNYVPDKNFPRFWMSIYEFVRDIHLFILSFRNPVWCVRGAVFAHVSQLARDVGGYRLHLTRGEDGAMAYDLMEFGKIHFKRGRKTRAYTSTKALSSDGHIVKAFLNRALDSFKGLRRYFFFTGDSDPLSPKNKNKS
ncbi:MAG: glycosyltransferase family 2 protein [Bacteroidales bacterium]